MANFTIEGRSKSAGDILRNWQFDVSLPEIKGLNIGADTEGLLIRTREASLPGRSMETIESSFMGTKQVYPGKSTFENTMEFTFEESDDQYISKVFHNWSEKIFQYNEEGSHPGASESSSKSSLVTPVYIKLRKYDQSLAKKMYKLVNAFPSDIGSVSLGYESNDSIKYSVTLTFDYWKLIDSE